MQRHVVEHREHDNAQQKLRSSTESGLSFRYLGIVLPLDPAWSGREGGVNSARLFLTIGRLNRIFLFHFNVKTIFYSNQQLHLLMFHDTVPDCYHLAAHSHSMTTYVSHTKKSSVAMGERRSSRWGNIGSCSCGPAYSRLGSIRSLSLRTK